MKWYARDPHRAIEGMAELTLEERGAYNTLIDHSYARDGDLPDDDPLIARMMGCHWRTWKAVKERLIERGKIILEGGKIVPNGVQDVLKEASRLSQEQSKRASRRWQKSKNANKNNKSFMRGRNANTDTDTDTDTLTNSEIDLSISELVSGGR